MAEQKEKNRSKSRKIFSYNIGMVIFGAIFLYMVVSVILYLTADHISTYQVTAGPLAQNETFTALALRDETVINADESGYIHMYTRENEKVAKGDPLYKISSDKEEKTVSELDEADLARLQGQMEHFSNSFSSNNFNDLYTFKYDLENNIQEYAQEGETIQDTDASMADRDGVIVYTTDGYEQLQAEDLKEEDFEQKAYKSKAIQNNDKVEAGSPVCKIITDEEWSIYIPVSKKQAARLVDKKNIRVKFLKDGNSEVGSLHMITIGDQRYAQITFLNSMIRYASDRFLEVELVTNTKNGLKIPISSIVQKEFFLVPTDMTTKHEENGTTGFLVEKTNKEGDVSSEFVEATLYAEDEEKEMYYVDKSEFHEGDVLIKPDSNTRYTVQETDLLEGVYCINKGYAVFRKIEILDQNEEFCIVDTGTTFGISQYDYIVLNGNSVKEEDILY